MKLHHMIKAGAIGCLIFGIVQSVSIAADTPAKPPVATKEQREVMAKAHEKAAACLRTTRPLAECRDEMMKACGNAMGDHGCEMMGAGMMSGNMMHAQKPAASQPTETKKP